MKTIRCKITSAYLFLVLVGLPLVMTDGYVNITETKHYFYIIASAVYFVAILAMLLVEILRNTLKVNVRLLFKRLTAIDYCVLAFGVLFALSCILSPYADDWLLGQNNRYQGLLTIATYVLTYFFVSRNFRFTQTTMLALLIGFCTAALIAFLNFCGVDPLGIYRQLDSMAQGRYITTIGNVNFYGSYLAIIFPMLLVQWCFVQKTLSRVIYMTALVIGTFGMLVSSSESFTLAFVAIIVIMPLFLFDKPQMIKRLIIAVMAILVTMQIFNIVYTNIETNVNVSYFMRLLLKWPVTLVLLAVCGLFLFLLRNRDTEPLVKCRRWYGITVGALAAAAVAAVVVINTAYADVPLGTIDRFLKFSDTWGTDRGKIWRFCAELFSSYDTRRALLGGGPGCIWYASLAQPLFSDAVLDQAHNEYLHYLVTNGVLVLTAYLFVIGSSVRTAWKDRAEDPLVTGCITGIIAYAVQALVNIAQPASTPLVFVFVGILAGSLISRQTTHVKH